VAFVAAQAHVNSALCHMHLNDTSSGIAAAQRAIALSESPSGTMSIVTRGIAEATLARLLLKAGQLEDATRHAAASEDFHMKAPTHLTSIETEITRSLIEIASNNVEGGAVRLSAALARCRRENPSELTDALVAAVDGFENAGQADVALTYLHELLALNRDSVTHKLLERLGAVAEVAPGAKPDPAATAKAIALATAVDNAISDLVNAAVTASEQAGHDRLRIFRVGRLAELLAGEIGWGAERAAALAFAARLANLGLLVIPDAVLRKPRGLSGAERRIVNEHTEFGADLLRKSRLAILQPAVQVAKFHHERWDGNGPWALAGDAIPMEARLTAIADCFDALTHPRPWREAYSVQDGLRFIAEGAGTQFDPSLASCFVGMVRRIFWDHSDFDKWLSQEGQENSYVQARAQLERLIRGDSETFRATAAVHSGHGMGRSDATDGGPSRFGP
jgi:putative two-component system response regulator